MKRYVHPDEFADLGQKAKAFGFQRVYAGPLLRSSFNAHEVSEMGGSISASLGEREHPAGQGAMGGGISIAQSGWPTAPGWPIWRQESPWPR